MEVILILNMVGTLAIIVSLLYLAKQTSLTNKIAKGESERELLDTFNELISDERNYKMLLIQNFLIL